MMKFSVLTLAASAAVASAHKYHHSPPEVSPTTPVYTPPIQVNITKTLTTKTIHPHPHPPPATTTIYPPGECPPVSTVTVWLSSPVEPSHKPIVPVVPEPGETETSGEELPPATQSGPQTVPTAAAASYGAPVALIAGGLVAAVVF